MDNGSIPSGAAGETSPQFAILNYFFPGFSMILSPLSSYLGTDINRYLPSVFLVLGITVAWGYVSQLVWDVIQRQLMSTVQLKSSDEVFDYFMTWLSHQEFSHNSRCFIVNAEIGSSYSWRYRDDSDDEDSDDDDEESSCAGNGDMAPIPGQKRQLHYTPSYGSHFFWFRGRPLLFSRTENREQVNPWSSSEREELSVSCFGRNPRILKELLMEARKLYMKKDERKTIIYRGSGGGGNGSEPDWQRCMSRLNRPFSTVILNDKVKKDLIADAADYLNPATRRWYANRGIPYRRGYLLYGPPGTGKSSLSLALAGYFHMKIYMVSLNSPSASEESLASLFAELPRRCVVLLEDIDSAGLTHTREGIATESPPAPQEQTALSAKMPPQAARMISTVAPTTGRLSLSGLLNILDGVASQEGRILIMTTNHIEHLDKALIRPGRIDMVIPFGLADREMTASIFRGIYAPYEGEVDSSTIDMEGVFNKGDTGTKPESLEARKAQIIEKISALADAFAAEIPECEFSPAQIQGLLLRHKHDPETAIKVASEWIEQTRTDTKIAQEREREAEKERQREAEKKREELEKEEKGDEDKKSKEKGKDEKRTTSDSGYETP